MATQMKWVNISVTESTAIILESLFERRKSVGIEDILWKNATFKKKAKELGISREKRVPIGRPVGSSK